MADGAAKTWFVTGASTGFGRLFVEEILAKGGKAIATARDWDTVADLAERFPGRVLTCRLDVTKPDDVREALVAAEKFGGFDVLVNNAGYGFLGGVEESTEDEIEAQFAVNYFGALRMIRAALPAMRKRGAGYILNISSIAGIKAFPGSTFYSASKFALEALGGSHGGGGAIRYPGDDRRAGLFPHRFRWPFDPADPQQPSRLQGAGGALCGRAAG